MELERDFDVISENVRLIQKRKEELLQILLGQYREALTVYEGLLQRSELSSPSDEAAWLFRKIYGDHHLCSAEFALFCLAFGEKFPHRLDSLQSLLREEEQESPEETGKTAYLQNIYGDYAFRRFSSVFRELKPMYSTSYASACEEVYYGRSSYVILPIYHSRDGYLITFRRMLRKYDLKLTSVCSVETDEGDIVLYGLAQKELARDRGDCLDLTLILPEGASAAQFFPICEHFGIVARLINSIPLEYASDSLNKHELHVIFSSENASFESFALFLDASHTRYEIEGIYNILT